MGAVMDIYQMVRDMIDEAKNQKNLELVEKLIDIKLALLEMEEEKRELEKKIEALEQSKITEDDLELKPKGYYIKRSEEKAGKHIRYCVACWQNINKLMPFVISVGNVQQCCNFHNVIR